MSSQGSSSFAPLEGVTVPGARIAHCVALFAGLLITTASAGMLLVALTVGQSLRLLIFSLIGVVAGPVILIWAAYELCFTQRLVLARDALQVLRGSRVIYHLPYGNIADVEYGKHEGARGIRFTLVDRRDP